MLKVSGSVTLKSIHSDPRVGTQTISHLYLSILKALQTWTEKPSTVCRAEVECSEVSRPATGKERVHNLH